MLFYKGKRKQLVILTVFTWFLTLEKIQDGGHDGDNQFGDVTDLKQRHHP